LTAKPACIAPALAASMRTATLFSNSLSTKEIDMKKLMKGYVYRIQYEHNDAPHLSWSQSSTMGEADPDWVLVGPHDFVIECPDDFDPRPHQLAAIDAKERAMRAAFTARITELQEQRNKLLALEMSA
jgi:hypothetical protein